MRGLGVGCVVVVGGSVVDSFLSSVWLVQMYVGLIHRCSSFVSECVFVTHSYRKKIGYSFQHAVKLEWNSIWGMSCCECCGQLATKRCGRCRVTPYCGVQCQKKHWRDGHRHKCIAASQDIAIAAADLDSEECGTGTIVAAPEREPEAERGEDECVICLDALYQPQTMPCGHRFCRGCILHMRERGVGTEHVCPLCRGPMPDASRLHLDAVEAIAQHLRWDCDCDSNGTMSREQEARLDRAISLCRQTLSIDPHSAQVHFDLGFALYKRGDVAGAIVSYRAAAHEDQTLAGVYSNLGCALRRSGRIPDAIAAFRTAIRTDASNSGVMAYYNLGKIYEKQGEIASAIDAYEAATRGCGSSPEERESTIHSVITQSHFSIGCLYGQQGNFRKAANSFASVLQLDPYFPEAMEYMSHAISDLASMSRR